MKCTLDRQWCVVRRFVFSTPGRQDMEYEVHELANNLKSLRSTSTPSPACPPPSNQAARLVVLCDCMHYYRRVHTTV